MLQENKPEPLPQEKDKIIFTVDQLDKITDIFVDLAPSGFIAERAFAFVLQDLLLNDDEHHELQVPLIWSMLKPEDINHLTSELFGSIEYVPWKDFILGNLFMSYPNVEELLKLRKQFIMYDQELIETVSYEDFANTEFWFQIDKNKAVDIRKLLFKLYRCSNDDFNYTAMLLDLCKGKYRHRHIYS